MRSARIAKIEHGREEVPFVVVHLEFMNAFEADQSLTSYTANWSGGTKHVNGLDLTVPRGSMIQRTLRIDPSDGDLQRIDETATVQW